MSDRIIATFNFDIEQEVVHSADKLSEKHGGLVITTLMGVLPSGQRVMINSAGITKEGGESDASD